MATKSLPNRNPSRKICSVSACPMLVRSRDLCNRHYTMLLRRGTTEPVHRHGVGTTQEDRFWSLVDKTPGFGPQGECWHWTASLTCGYGSFHFNGTRQRAHRISYYLAHHRWPKGFARHTCDNRTCVRPDHLLEGTPQDNVDDMITRKRHRFGERHQFAKLREVNVREILTSTLDAGTLAEKFNIARSTVYDIRRRKIWTHVVVNVEK